MKSPTPTSLTLKTPCKTLEKTEAREDNLIKNYATNNLVQPSRCQPCCPVSAILPSPSSAERPSALTMVVSARFETKYSASSAYP